MSKVLLTTLMITFIVSGCSTKEYVECKTDVDMHTRDGYVCVPNCTWIKIQEKLAE